MLSTLELSRMIESSFLPVRCRCTWAADRSLTVDLRDHGKGIDLKVAGIRPEQLTSSREIVGLVSRLRCELLDKQNVVQLRNAG